MGIPFYKYQGTGNDFIIIDNRKEEFSFLTRSDISNFCHRKFGIGADGLIFLESHDTLDFRMRYFNSDGLEGSMCGNGGRCVVAFAGKLKIIENRTEFMAFDGIHEAILKDDNYVELSMSDVTEIIKRPDGFFLDTGSPHFVRIDKNIKHIDVSKEGKLIRYSDEFSPNGTNVNFVELIDDNSIEVRTYERGVEGETLSCGTGVVAASICTYFSKGFKDLINIKTAGGDLTVRYNVVKNKEGSFRFNDIWLCGGVGNIYNGIINHVPQ